MGPYQANGLLCVVYLIRAGIVTVSAQTTAQDDGVDAVVVKEGNEVRTFRAHVQGVVAASGHEDYGCAGIQSAVDGVHLDRGVVDVDDAVDSPGHRLAHVVLLSLADLFLVEGGRV